MFTLLVSLRCFAEGNRLIENGVIGLLCFEEMMCLGPGSDRRLRACCFRLPLLGAPQTVLSTASDTAGYLVHCRLDTAEI